MRASFSNAYARPYFYFANRTERPTRRFLDKDITCGPARAERKGLTLINPCRDLIPVPRRVCLKQTMAEAINLRAFDVNADKPNLVNTACGKNTVLIAR